MTRSGKLRLALLACLMLFLLSPMALQARAGGGGSSGGGGGYERETQRQQNAP